MNTYPFLCRAAQHSLNLINANREKKESSLVTYILLVEHMWLIEGGVPLVASDMSSATRYFYGRKMQNEVEKFGEETVQ